MFYLLITMIKQTKISGRWAAVQLTLLSLNVFPRLTIKKAHSGQDVNRQMRFNQWQDYDE
ncbi:hypothetical protein BN1182_CI_01120 [Pantoea ananatis]|nr:hypothetical protein BN1182_CI_01120 [Pantoea ananatis]